MKHYKLCLNNVTEEKDLVSGKKYAILDAKLMSDISYYYEVQCTAEYVAENYPNLTEEEAEEVAYEVRHQMDKYGLEETEAIDIVMEEMDFEREDD